MDYKLSPSLICMDMLDVGGQLKTMGRYADYLHIDVMDGQFVPSMGLFPAFVEAVHRGSTLDMDCHLMVAAPMKHIQDMAALGATTLIPHAEAMATGAFRILDKIHECGCRAGVAVNPATSLDAVRPYLHKLQRLTIMTIEPGYPGAPFIWEMVDKIKEACRLRETLGLDFEIEMDGSLCDDNLMELYKAGCDVFVAGNAALFGRGDNLEAGFRELRDKFNHIPV